MTREIGISFSDWPKNCGIPQSKQPKNCNSNYKCTFVSTISTPTSKNKPLWITSAQSPLKSTWTPKQLIMYLVRNNSIYSLCPICSNRIKIQPCPICLQKTGWQKPEARWSSFSKTISSLQAWASKAPTLKSSALSRKSFTPTWTAPSTPHEKTTKKTATTTSN